MRSRALGIALLFMCGFAGANETADHPIVGRFGESEVVHQEISRFEEYELSVSEEDTQIIQGEVWMTLYDAPEDSSTFSVYSTYREFLEGEGFEILSSYRPGDSPPELLEEVYFLNPFADNGNFAHPAPFTNGNDDMAAYIAARRGDGIYVSIAIAAGWAAYPQYKLDVIVVRSNTGGIASVGTAPQPESDDEPEKAGVIVEEPEATSADSGEAPTRVSEAGRGTESSGLQSGRFFTGEGPIILRAGIAGYLMLDPAIAGGLVDIDDNGTPSSRSEGFRNIYGPYARAVWFPNKNVGIGFEASYFQSDESFSVDADTYQSVSEFQLYRAVAVVRMTGHDFPATISMGFSGGAALIALSQSRSGGTTTYTYAVEDTLAVFGTSIDMSIPILRFLHLSAGFEYVFIPFTTLALTSEDGSYARTYHEGNLGGLAIRLGGIVDL